MILPFNLHVISAVDISNPGAEKEALTSAPGRGYSGETFKFDPCSLYENVSFVFKLKKEKTNTNNIMM
jgi:hypothetical protein